MCDCKVGPGKFEGETALTFLAYQSMLLGNVDLTVGPVDFFKAPFNFDANREVVPAARAYGYCEDCIREALDSEAYGMSLWERSDGFVYGQTYETAEEYDKAVETAEDEDEDDGEGY